MSKSNEVLTINPVIREELGKLVRQVWIDFCNEIGDTKPSHIAEWEDLSEAEREVDRRIGVAVSHHVAAKICKVLNVTITDLVVDAVFKEDK